MLELLRRTAAQDPGRPAVVTHEQVVSYAELAAAAEHAAVELSRRGVTRFAVADHEALPVVALLAAASGIGAECCLYPPDGPNEIADLVARFDHRVVVTDREDLVESSLPSVESRIATAELLGGSGSSAVEPVAVPEGVRPHLVLTTGTTGAPRGVRHDWNRLVRTVGRVTPAGDERWLLAYGLHQFAGLQILLHVFAAGATLVAPAPRRPREGLRALRELDVTHASATPTYWRFLVAEMVSDGGAVPALQQITMGGEAVPDAVLATVRGAFPGARVSQVYAASEFGSTGSVRDGRPGLSVDVLERGDDADVALRVDDGQLWIRSRTGMLGYHGEPDVDPDAWRPTGDLVEVVGDRIVFLGRSSEVINVGGVKVHPLVVEDRVGAVPGVAALRVYGRTNAMTGQIVALEVVLADGADRAAVEPEIRAATADLPAAARPRSIKFVDEILTRGSKVLRREQTDPR